MASTTGLSDSVAGLLCYLLGWITGIVFLIFERKSRFVRFHAAQSTLVFGLITVLGLLLPHVFLVGDLLYALLSAISFIVWILMMVTAVQHKTIRLPIIADVADQLIR